MQLFFSTSLRSTYSDSRPSDYSGRYRVKNIINNILHKIHDVISDRGKDGTNTSGCSEGGRSNKVGTIRANSSWIRPSSWMVTRNAPSWPFQDKSHTEVLILLSKDIRFITKSTTNKQNLLFPFFIGLSREHDPRFAPETLTKVFLVVGDEYPCRYTTSGRRRPRPTTTTTTESSTTSTTLPPYFYGIIYIPLKR